MTSHFRTLSIPGIFTLLLSLLVFALPAHCQLSAGAIQGSVTDKQGAKVSGANVTVADIGTGSTITLVTDARGNYSAPVLPIGKYRIQVTQTGFSSAVAGPIVLTVGQQAVIDFSLAVGAVSETVDVGANVPQVDTTDSSVRFLVGADQVQNLPLNGRNYIQLVLLTPGVQSVPGAGTGGNSTLVAFGFGSPQLFSVAGGRPEGELFLLDGTDTAGVYGAGTGFTLGGTSLGVDAISEFEVLTNTYSAKYGGNGGVVNSVLRSGTNSLHGSAYEFARNSALDARNYFDPAGAGALPFSRNQFGGTLGGPIRKNRTFYFANYEELNQKLTTSLLSVVPDANFRQGILPCGQTLLGCTAQPAQVNVGVSPAVAGYLAAFATPNGPENGDGTVTNNNPVNRPLNEHYGVIKVTHNLSASSSLLFSYNIDDGNLGTPLNSSVVDQDSQRDQILTIEEQNVISPTKLNVAHFSFTRARVTVASDYNPALTIVPGSGLNGNLEVNGLSQLGGQDNTAEAVNRYTGRDQFSLIKGRHSLDFGVQVVRHQVNANIPVASGGVVLYSPVPVTATLVLPSYQAFLSNTALAFVGVPASASDSQRNIRHTNLAGYVQDTWKLSTRLTANLGLRYDYETNPVEAHNKLYNLINPLTDTGFTNVPHAFVTNLTKYDFQPRVGFALDVFGNQKTSLRGGYATFADVPLDLNLYIAYAFNPPLYNLTTILFPTLPNPFGGGGINATGLPGSNTFYSYNSRRNPNVQQYNLNIQQDLSHNLLLTLGYIGSKGSNLFIGQETNACVPTGIAANGYYIRSENPTTCQVPNPALSNVLTREPIGYSNYNSGIVSVDKTVGKYAQFRTAYTWSKCLDIGSYTSALDAVGPNGGTTGLQVGSLTAPGINHDYGPCDFDVRNNLTTNLILTLPFHGSRWKEGYQLTAIGSVHSGTPFNVYDGFDQANAGASGFANDAERPDLAPGRMPTKRMSRTSTGTFGFDPSAYELQPAGQFGNLGRNTLTAPGIGDLDLGVSKNTRLSEHSSLLIRAEAFNATNHSNLGFPNPQLFLSASSQNPTAGQITSTATDNRQIQLSGKFIF